MNNNSYVGIGVVGRPFGLKGDVIFHLYNEQSKTLTSNMNVFLKSKDSSDYVTLQLETTKKHSGKLILKFVGINDLDEVKKLVQFELYVLRSELSNLQEGEYYLCDILGFEVFEHPDTLNNLSIGNVKSFSMNNAFQTIIHILLKTGKEIEILAYPFVKSVDLKRSRCYIMIPEYVE